MLFVQYHPLLWPPELAEKRGEEGKEKRKKKKKKKKKLASCP